MRSQLDRHEDDCECDSEPDPTYECRKCHRTFVHYFALQNHLNDTGHRVGPNYQASAPQNQTMVVYEPPQSQRPAYPFPQYKPPQQQIYQSPPQSVQQSLPRTQAPSQILPPPQHRCEACFANFDTSVALNTHTEATHVFKCDKCTGKFGDVDSLGVHKREAHTYKCKCRKKFVSQAALAKHQAEDHDFPCKKCAVSFETFKEHQKHMEERHEFKCTKCSATFESPDKLSDHHLDVHTLRCDKCRQKFNCAEDLLGHISKDHNFNCTKCTESGVFETAAALALHETARHTIRCPQCQTTHSSDSALNDHVRLRHSFRCIKCTGAKFESTEALTTHLNAVHNVTCNVCDRTLGDVRMLLMHYEQAHGIRCPNEITKSLLHQR